MAKEKKGNTSTDKGVFIPKEDRAPNRPEYLHLSKADAMAAEVKRKADDAKVKKFRKDLTTEKPEEKEDKPESKVAEAAKAKAKAAKEKKDAAKKEAENK